MCSKKDRKLSNPVLLNEKSHLQLLSKSKLSSAILFEDSELENNKGTGYQLLYFTGDNTTYKHWMGEFSINEKVLSEMVANFNSGIAGQKIPVNYNHYSNEKAAGWIINLYLSDDKRTLLGDIEWTPAGAQAIRDKEYQYYSSEFYLEKFKTSETEQTYSNVLSGGALTNIPFLKKTDIKLSESENQETAEEVMTKEEMIVALKEHGVDVVELQTATGSRETQLSELQTKLSATEQRLSESQVELSALKLSVAESSVNALYDKALSEGKICPAQEAMFKGYVKSIDLSDAAEYASKLPVIVKFEAHSSSAGSDQDDLSDETVLFAKAEAYSKENKCSFEEAVKAIKAGGK